MRIRWWLGATSVAIAVLMGGCGSGDDGGSATDSAAGSAANEQAAKQGAAEAPQGAAPDANKAEGGQAGAPVEFRKDDRAIIYTGSISVRVDDVERAATRATSIATGAGGFVGGDKRSSGGSYTEATITLRIPAGKFAGVVDELAGLGKQERRDINTEDVTEEALDLDARIATQRARVDSGRRLLAQAKTLADLVMLESELAKREADLASLEAKKRRLDDLTALSTITVELLGPGATLPEEDDDATGFLAGLKGGWKALAATFGVLVTVLGALLPWLVALGVPALGGVWLYRRLRRPRPST
ncbi:DUF4349 domain-containing protein [Phytohabitans aurantiacus]|nr:DUF4349 domain-containing protein [Phytohabitans aurantiacus]